MKPKIFTSLLPILMALFLFTGANEAQAIDVGVSIGTGGHYHSGGYYRDYRTSDSGYTTWYPSTNSYTYYSTPTYTYPRTYVYTTPSVEFNTWYGNGYRSHSGHHHHGRSGYYGGHRHGWRR